MCEIKLLETNHPGGLWYAYIGVSLYTVGTA